MINLFIIGLREALEASLIISIVCSMIISAKRKDLLRYVILSIFCAVILCIGIGISINYTIEMLDQKYQEMIEFFIGIFSVIMVSSMIFWMRKNTLQVKLKNNIKESISKNKSSILLCTVFLAVFREGLELVSLSITTLIEADTYLLYVALFAGIMLAVVLAYCIYRMIFKMNLKLFFNITNAFLIIFAAGILVNSVRSAHSAGLMNLYNNTIVDLSQYIPSNSLFSTLMSSLFGINSDIQIMDCIVWTFYFIFMIIVLNINKLNRLNKSYVK